MKTEKIDETINTACISICTQLKGGFDARLPEIMRSLAEIIKARAEIEKVHMSNMKEDGFDISDFSVSDKFVRIIETEHCLFLNGIAIPYVCRDSVRCKDDGHNIKKVSLKILTDSYIRLTGAASEAFEEKHGIKESPDYTFM